MSDKWQNKDAGPRQVKDLQHAIYQLTSEGQTHDELTGVMGGEERRSSYMSMFGPVRPEVTALDQAIREKYANTVTRANVREIIAAYEAALPQARESRPVADSRRTPEEEAERLAAAAARDAEDQAKRDAEDAVMTAVMAKAPRGAKGLILAEWHEDNSDPMTDYFNSITRRTVAIGFRMSSREDFRALHAAAAGFAETAGIEFEERRENYSMGAGNYLSDHGSARSGTGWVIKSRDFPCKWVTLTEDAIPEQPASGGNGFYDQHGNWVPQASATPAGPVTVTPSSIGREGVVEVRFADKPGPDVLAALKAHGFRWARGNRCWYGRDAAYAESLAAV